MKKSFLMLLCFFLLIASCKNGVNDHGPYNAMNTIKKIVFNDKNEKKYTVIYSFYKNGEIKEIHKYNNVGRQSGEQLWFDSNGILEKKSLL
jgi:antitoxin component YwqK of YwqJK toxin-antitoxin module